jgi:hypothetical protein
MSSIVALCAYPYAGKDTFCQEVLPHYKVISVSSIVKKLSQAQDRVGLQGTAHLAPQIAEGVENEVFRAVEEGNVAGIVINGIRQQSILEALLERFPNLRLVWLEAHEAVRERRFTEHVQAKDVGILSYSDLIKKEKALGLGEVESFMKSSPRTVIIDSSVDHVFKDYITHKEPSL